MWRVIFEQHYISDQSTRTLKRFKQIVTQQVIFGDLVVQAFLEGVYIIDALADEISLAEQVLIDIGYGAGIQVYD